MIKDGSEISTYRDSIREFADAVIGTFGDAAHRLLPDEPMSAHSTFKVGGNADIAFSAASSDELAFALKLAAAMELPVTVLGNGSNILVSDRGIRGVVILLGRDMAEITCGSGGMVTAQAGALLSSVSRFAASQSLTGMEFAGGIPGTIGGAVYMNAGAYDGCMGDIVIRSEGYRIQTGEIFTLPDLASHQFGYRRSFFNMEQAIVLKTWLQLRQGTREEIDCKMTEFAKRRRNSQPLEQPSAGSTFKRPEGHFAGRLIEDAGLKGCRIGGACVSTKHAGFIVNDSGATASEVLALIDHVRRCVYDKDGVMLEPEVRILGEW
ncbi:MAG: UDP-N-acetylmuramate dehydrogenase [Saccharofermentanales bacterium]